VCVTCNYECETGACGQHAGLKALLWWEVQSCMILMKGFFHFSAAHAYYVFSLGMLVWVYEHRRVVFLFKLTSTNYLSGLKNVQYRIIYHFRVSMWTRTILTFYLYRGTSWHFRTVLSSCPDTGINLETNISVDAILLMM